MIGVDLDVFGGCYLDEEDMEKALEIRNWIDECKAYLSLHETPGRLRVERCDRTGFIINAKDDDILLTFPKYDFDGRFRHKVEEIGEEIYLEVYNKNDFVDKLKEPEKNVFVTENPLIFLANINKALYEDKELLIAYDNNLIKNSRIPTWAEKDGYFIKCAHVVDGELHEIDALTRNEKDTIHLLHKLKDDVDGKIEEHIRGDYYDR